MTLKLENVQKCCSHNVVSGSLFCDRLEVKMYVLIGTDVCYMLQLVWNNDALVPANFSYATV